MDFDDIKTTEETPEATESQEETGGEGQHTETPSDQPTGKPEGTTGEQAPKEVNVNDLTDEQFEKLFARLISDPKSPYNNNPAWQRMIKQRDGQRQRGETVLKHMATKNPDLAREYLLSEGYDEEDIKALFGEMGVDVGQGGKAREKAERSAGPEIPEIKVDEQAFIDHMIKLGVDVYAMTNEQREFWKLKYQSDKLSLKPYEDELKKRKDEESRRTKAEQNAKAKKEYEDTVKWIDETYGANTWVTREKEIREYLDTHPHFSGNVKQLFFACAGENGWFNELIKNQKSIEDAKLIEQKKKMNTEKPGSFGKTETLPAGVGIEGRMSDTFRHLDNKYK